MRKTSSQNSESVAIAVDGVSKTFKLPHERLASVKGALVGLTRRRTYERQQVLKDVSFDIKQGEFFGIVGRNGSGKSTLLKLLSGIYTPSKGRIDVRGKLTPFIELGVGFNPELTGRENVFLNGALLGFTRKETEGMYDDIVEFAELERFMDQKLKNYSSGMQVRLAFSIAIQSKSDIFLFDEVLAVGDYAFQQKCYEYFKYLKSIKKTVVLVSHDASALQMFCTDGVLIENGQVQKRGTIQEVLKEYAKQNVIREEQKQTKTHAAKKQVEGGENVKLLSVHTELAGKKQKTFRPHDKITIVYEVEAQQTVVNPVVGLVLQDASGGQPIFATNTMDQDEHTGTLEPGVPKKIKFTIDNIFNDSILYISGAIANDDRSHVYVRFYNAGSFNTVGWDKTARGTVYLPHTIEVQ
jgi:ABC-2 type transport system ATP-binding protein